MSIHASRSEDSFLRLHINPFISKSPAIDDFQKIEEELKTINESVVNKNILASFLNIFNKADNQIN
jgi:hypothetical protein